MASTNSWTLEIESTVAAPRLFKAGVMDWHTLAPKLASHISISLVSSLALVPKSPRRKQKRGPAQPNRELGFRPPRRRGKEREGEGEMTTAARPTWAPAKGGNEQGGTRIFGPSGKYSSRDLAAHTSLKPRKEGQQTQEEVQKRNLREELEEREHKHFSSKDKSYVDERDRRKSSGLLLEGSKREEDKIVPREIDADDSDVEPRSDDESDDDDDDDDTEALMAELERIKKERAEDKLRKDRQQAEEEAKMKEAELMRGNPLINMNNSGSFNVKRRWDDDVVFKNQARGETKTPKRFINDTIRSDFHRKFLHRYMK